MTFLNEPELIFFLTVNGFTYLYLIRIILFTINHLFAQFNIIKHCYLLRTIQHQSFVYTQLNDQTVLFQKIQFSKSKQFKCHTVLFDP